MTRLLELQELLQDTSAAIAMAEQAVAVSPDSFGLLINQRSLRKRFQELEEEFSRAAAELSVDVCRYRMFLDHGQPNALASTTAIASFQQLVSLFYDTMTTRAKTRARTSADAIKQTSFGIGYVFPGSIGFVLTLPAELSLLDPNESPIDSIIATIFAIAKSRDEQKLTDIAKTLGPSVVRSIYKWASLHTANEMGVDISWNRGGLVKSTLFLQRQELSDLRNVIERTSERIDDDVEIDGVFVGGDVVKETVHIQSPGIPDINAEFHELFMQSQLPHGFRVPVHARFIRRTKIYLATEREEVTWLITKIEELANVAGDNGNELAESPKNVK